MSLLHNLRLFTRKLGVDVSRYKIEGTQEGNLVKLFKTHNIDLILDVGANDGGYGSAIRKAGYVGSIISFEPLTVAHDKLCDNSKSDQHWEVAPRMAIGSENGDIKINIAGNSTSSSLLEMEALHKKSQPNSTYIDEEDVRITRLDDFRHDLITNKRNLFLKIDTQGYESEVLKGAEKTLGSITGVQLELSLFPLYRGQVLYQELMTNLIDLGFELNRLIPGFTDHATGKMLQMDGVFIRKHN
jgi:FkbM family methyltransferase